MRYVLAHPAKASTSNRHIGFEALAGEDAYVQLVHDPPQAVFPKQAFQLAPPADVLERGVAIEHAEVNLLPGQIAVAEQAQHPGLFGVEAVRGHPRPKAALDAFLARGEAVQAQRGAHEIEERANGFAVGLAQSLLGKPELRRVEARGQPFQFVFAHLAALGN